jgi:hypothetical protein
MSHWNGQDVGNAMWGCARLGMAEDSFLSAVQAAAHKWLPQAAAPALNQVALAYGMLYQTEQQQEQQEQQQQQQQVMVGVVERAQQLLSSLNSNNSNRSHADRRSPLLQQNRVTTPASIGWSVAVLNMQQLAGAAVALVAAGVQESSKLTTENARQLWVLHTWLMKHQLLDQQGLAAVLTPAQLAVCEAQFMVPPTGTQCNQLEICEGAPARIMAS